MSKILVRFETSEMKKALDVASAVINKKVALPILSNVLLRYDRQRNVFLMLASNSEQWLTLECSSMKKEGDETVRKPWLLMIKDDQGDPFTEVAIDNDTLRRAIAGLPDMPCQATIDTESHTLHVDYQKGQFSLPIESNAAEFPPVPVVATIDSEHKENAVVRMTVSDGQWLLQTMTQANTCTANDELRPVMNAVLIDFFQDKYVVVASDGHSLYRLIKDTGVGYLDYGNFAADADAAVLVPKQTLGILQKALGGMRALTLTADLQRVMFSADGVSVVSVAIDGHYPNYNSVIPKDNPHQVVISRHELSAALRRVQVFANDASNMVEISREGDFLALSANDYDFNRQANERVAMVNGESTTLPEQFKIGCKISTMLGLLSIIPSDDVQILMADATRAMLLKPDDAKQDLTLLQMPMMVNS